MFADFLNDGMPLSNSAAERANTEPRASRLVHTLVLWSPIHVDPIFIPSKIMLTDEVEEHSYLRVHNINLPPEFQKPKLQQSEYS